MGSADCLGISDRPPLGLRPKYIVQSMRAKEILEAMLRYTDAGEKIPQEWLEELMEVCK